MTLGRVVALGGGHGLSVTLRAVAPLAAQVTAVVSTADDGGSTGRLRSTYDIPGIGDARRCLAALADRSRVWGRLLERRFASGELAGHAAGNLLLLALREELGSLQAACDEVARTAGVDLARARVVPATEDAVVLCGRTEAGEVVVGQVDVAATARLEEIWVVPGGEAPGRSGADAPPVTASPVARDAIARADLVVVGPGSLFTSVLAAVVVGDLRKALSDTAARVAYVANLRAEQAETRGFDLAAHLAALGRHGVHADIVLVDPRASVARAPIELDVREADIADRRGALHDPAKLGPVLASLTGT